MASAAATVIPDDVASMWRSLDPAIRAALIASESKKTKGGDTIEALSGGAKVEPSTIGSSMKENDESDNDEKSSSFSLTEAERLITFSDAVVAIAMTLLILPIMEASAEFDFESIGKFWEEYRKSFVALFVSFWAIWKFWLTHEHLFMRVSHFNVWLHRLNFLWLLGIVLLPVFTNVLLGANGLPVYIGDFLFIRTVTLFIGRVIWSDNRVWKDNATSSGLAPAFFVSVIVDIVLLLLALLLTLYVSVYGFAVIFLGHPIVWLCEWKWPQIGTNTKESISSQVWDLFWEIAMIPRIAFERMNERIN